MKAHEAVSPFSVPLKNRAKKSHDAESEREERLRWRVYKKTGATRPNTSQFQNVDIHRFSILHSKKVRSSQALKMRQMPGQVAGCTKTQLNTVQKALSLVQLTHIHWHPRLEPVWQCRLCTVQQYTHISSQLPVYCRTTCFSYTYPSRPNLLHLQG